MTNFDIYRINLNSVHFIGIGGVSMSGLASILLNDGVAVSGSDMGDSSILTDLKASGVKVFNNHSAENIKSPDLVIYTDAISSDNTEYIEALNKNIPMVDRGTFLGQLMKKYKKSIAVSGTHGKTSTTGMLSVILGSSELNPTILLGGYLDQLGGNIQIGDSELLITEACEYKRNLLKFHSTIGIILNIDADHLDYYKDLNEIVETFAEFASSIPANGHLVINSDDPSSEKVIECAKSNIATFGVDSNARYRASNISYHDDGTTSYSLNISGLGEYAVSLGVLGLHNVYNSLGAIASAHIAGADIDYILNNIVEFKGTQRRFQLKGVSEGFKIIDDYAHHPTEVMATLSAVKNLNPKSVWCIFQPHTYTRTKSLMDDFAVAFSDADKVIITDIYAAREKDTGLVHSRDLVEKLQEKKCDAIFMESFKDIEDYILKSASSGDVIITMGAGDVYKIGDSILKL